MTTILPEPTKVLKAVELYINMAYAGASPPATVRTILGKLQSADKDFYQISDFVRSGDPEKPSYKLRLGNSIYPHMKLTLEPDPSGNGYILRVDSHDAQIAAISSDHPEHAAICRLREKNQEFARQIEAAWQEAGLPTFQSY